MCAGAQLDTGDPEPSKTGQASCLGVGPPKWGTQMMPQGEERMFYLTILHVQFLYRFYMLILNVLHCTL